MCAVAKGKWGGTEKAWLHEPRRAMQLATLSAAHMLARIIMVYDYLYGFAYCYRTEKGLVVDGLPYGGRMI